jgi:hypothetical protein
MSKNFPSLKILFPQNVFLSSTPFAPLKTTHHHLLFWSASLPNQYSSMFGQVKICHYASARHPCLIWEFSRAWCGQERKKTREYCLWKENFGLTMSYCSFWVKGRFFCWKKFYNGTRIRLWQKLGHFFIYKEFFK